MVFTYSDGTKVGEHEKHLRKVGSFLFENPYMVTFVSKEDTVEFLNYETTERVFLNEGIILSTCGLLKTNSARVEIRNRDGDLYRLASNSEFSIEYTVEGIRPVFYGKVLYASEDTITYSPEKNRGPIKHDYKRSGGGKYRTSCYMFNFGKGIVVIDSLGPSEDVYYNLSGPLAVYEYDEMGRQFTIFTAEPFQKIRLRFDNGKKLRERYQVLEKSRISNSRLSSLYQHFIFQNSWGS